MNIPRIRGYSNAILKALEEREGYTHPNSNTRTIKIQNCLKKRFWDARKPEPEKPASFYLFPYMQHFSQRKRQSKQKRDHLKALIIVLKN